MKLPFYPIKKPTQWKIKINNRSKICRTRPIRQHHQSWKR